MRTSSIYPLSNQASSRSSVRLLFFLLWDVQNKQVAAPLHRKTGLRMATLIISSLIDHVPEQLTRAECVRATCFYKLPPSSIYVSIFRSHFDFSSSSPKASTIE